MAINTDIYAVDKASFAPIGKEQRYAPVKMAGELFVLHRDGIVFDFNGDTSKGPVTLSGKGVIHLTTHRIVFIKNGKIEDHGSFSVFEVPLAYFGNKNDINAFPDFVQPTFGTNYLEGAAQQLEKSKYPANGVVRIKFRNGGCDGFLRVFMELWRQTKINEARRRELNSTIADPWSLEKFMQGAGALVANSNDISVIYTNQPVNPSHIPPAQTYEDMGVTSTAIPVYKPH